MTAETNSDKPTKSVTLETECAMEIWSGFFRINADGYQPECGHTIRIEVDEESLERKGSEVSPCFSVECPKCGNFIEPWCESWEVVETNRQTTTD